MPFLAMHNSLSTSKSGSRLLIPLCLSDSLSTFVECCKLQRRTRPAWAGFKTAEEGRTKIM